jgi:hypothetical protein
MDPVTIPAAAASSRWNVGGTGPQILELRTTARSSTKLKMAGIADPLLRRDSPRLGQGE